MKRISYLKLLTFNILAILFLASCQTGQPTAQFSSSETPTQITATSKPEGASTIEIISPPTPSPEPTPFPILYNCRIAMDFQSGPLMDQSTRFTVLGEDYFSEKGDKFYPGKNTAVYYNYQRYLLLHSAYEDGNLLKPLEAEFLRLYLERWGDLSNTEILNNINNLVGSEVEWQCNDQQLFHTTITDIVRLSFEASQHLWLEPRSIERILAEREGSPDDWIGEMTPSHDPFLYLSFCGWGPEDLGNARIDYYRYVIRFEVSD